MKFGLHLLFGILLALPLLAQAKPAPPCRFEVAIAKPSEGNVCLQEIGKQITNVEDRKKFFSKLKSWSPPKGLNVTLSATSIQVAIRDHVVRATWMSMDPAMIFWNGKIYVEKGEHSSLSAKFDNLMDQIDGRTSAYSDWLLPAAYAATPVTAEDQALRDVVFFYSERSYGSLCKYSSLLCTFKEDAHPRGADPETTFSTKRPTVECHNGKPTKFNFKLTEGEDNLAFGVESVSWEPVPGKENSYIVSGIGKGKFLVEYTDKPKAQVKPFEPCSNYAVDTRCSPAMEFFLTKRPDLSDFFVKNDQTPACDNFIRKQDVSDCHSSFSQYFKEEIKVPQQATAFGISPNISECKNDSCTESTPLIDDTAVSKAFSRDYRQGFIDQKKQEFDAHKERFYGSPQNISEFVTKYRSVLTKNGFSDDEVNAACPLKAPLDCKLPKGYAETLNDYKAIGEVNSAHQKIVDAVNDAKWSKKGRAEKYDDRLDKDRFNFYSASGGIFTIKDMVYPRILTACQSSQPCMQKAAKAGIQLCGTGASNNDQVHDANSTH